MSQIILPPGYRESVPARPSLSHDDLLTLDNPRPVFEKRLEVQGRQFWMYSVNGHLVHGECILVEAPSASKAEDIAQTGLNDTIRALREHRSAYEAETSASILTTKGV